MVCKHVRQFKNGLSLNLTKRVSRRSRDLSSKHVHAGCPTEATRNLTKEDATETLRIATVQKAAQLFNQAVYAIVIAVILLIVAAFAVAPNRRRIAAWVGLVRGRLPRRVPCGRADFVLRVGRPDRDPSQPLGCAGGGEPGAGQPPRRHAHRTADWSVVAIIAFMAGSTWSRSATGWRTRRSCASTQGVPDRRAGAALVYLNVASLTFGKFFLAVLIVAALEFGLWRIRSMGPAAVTVGDEVRTRGAHDAAGTTARPTAVTGCAAAATSLVVVVKNEVDQRLEDLSKPSASSRSGRDHRRGIRDAQGDPRRLTPRRWAADRPGSRCGLAVSRSPSKTSTR